jgi:hypothetical protein
MSEQHQAIATVLCFNTPIPCPSEPTALAAGLLIATLDASTRVATAIGSSFETKPRVTYVSSKTLLRFLLRLGVNQSPIADRQKHPNLSCTDIPLYSHGGTPMFCHLF